MERGLKQVDKLQLLIKELERLSVDCEILEIKGTDFGEFTTVDDHLMILSGKERKPHHGVVMWIHKLTSLHVNMCKAVEFKQLLYLCFVDFAKAFDTISHVKLWGSF